VLPSAMQKRLAAYRRLNILAGHSGTQSPLLFTSSSRVGAVDSGDQTATGRRAYAVRLARGQRIFVQLADSPGDAVRTRGADQSNSGRWAEDRRRNAAPALRSGKRFLALSARFPVPSPSVR
jgi:hypothetical protein